jgi:hypothetical protein
MYFQRIPESPFLPCRGEEVDAIIVHCPGVLQQVGESLILA